MGVTFITTLNYFISLETANTQKSEIFLLRISLGNLIASVFSCQYPQNYNISFRKEFLETLCKCNYLRILTTNSRTPCVGQSHQLCFLQVVSE